MSVTTISSTVDIEAFKMYTPREDEPNIVWDETREVRLPDGCSTNNDAALTVVLNVDDGMWDFVIPDLIGADKIDAIDRAIHVLTECRVALLATGSDTTGKCLSRDAAGSRCEIRGRHDVHRYKDPVA